MSTALHILTQQELDHLLVRAQKRNREEGITGVLLCSEGSFLQCLEGPASGIARIFGFIRADPLHHKIFELLSDPLETREFSQWSMGFRSTNPRLSSAMEGDDGLRAKLTAPAGVLSPARHLLESFWNQGLGTRYKTARAA